MKYLINGIEYDYSQNVKENTRIRHSFNDLAVKIFGLSFENWYQSGYWKDAYIPHVLLHNDMVVANVSVNIMDFLFKNQPKRCVQIGTVMTDTEYRNKGLSKFLMEKVLCEWESNCDGIYLYANDSVTEFYPRFGFKKTNEFQYFLPMSGGTATAVKLNMEKDEDVALLIKMYQKGNRFSRLSMLNNEGLLMFYCGQFMKDSIYYCRDWDAVVIADFEGKTMNCYDIFGGDTADMLSIIHSIAKSQTESIHFGFTPKEPDQMQVAIRKEEDTTFFWNSSKECIFDRNKLMFPSLSHA